MLGAITLTLIFTTVVAQSEETICAGCSEFLAVDEAVNFVTAEGRCVEKGGKLAVPFSEIEHNDTVEVAIRLGGNFNFGLVSCFTPRMVYPNRCVAADSA